MHRVSRRRDVRVVSVAPEDYFTAIEEFYSWVRYFSDHGGKVIASEGPGRDAARRKYGFALDDEWEKPGRSVLDYFRLHDVTWLGMSMAGILAFEPLLLDHA